MAKNPPRGYFSQEWPRPHNIGGNFSLNLEDETKNSTIIPIFLGDQAYVDPQNVDTNPKNANFGVGIQTNMYPDSIIPKINFSFSARMTKGAIETDALRSIVFHWMPIYTAFLDSLEAEDEVTTDQVEDIIEMNHETTDKQAYPLWSGIDLSEASNLPSDVPALTTNQVHESVAFSLENFYDAMHYYTNKNMLKKAVGQMHVQRVYRDRPYSYHSNNFTNPRCKRINPYTFCGVLFHVQQASQVGQDCIASEVTNIPHLHIKYKLRWDQWNIGFNQNAS